MWKANGGKPREIEITRGKAKSPKPKCLNQKAELALFAPKIMATFKQIEANRRNALKSTGPKTPEGKAVVALNALRRGLRARTVVLPGEDRQEFLRLCKQLECEWQPLTRTEQAYVEQLAIALWKLSRLDKEEAALFDQPATIAQFPLLHCLWQAQSRLERAFARAHLNLEHLQKTRRQESALPSPAPANVGQAAACGGL